MFYAAQTLKQLAKYDEGKKILPLCSIKDYPDVLFRGTVEGFYGQPWSHADRIEQIRFYGRIKLNTYIYGPKDDPYHSSPNWRKPYPAEEAEHIKELAKEAAHNKVNFGLGHPPGTRYSMGPDGQHEHPFQIRENVRFGRTLFRRFLR